MLIEGVLEAPMVRKMGNEILGYPGKNSLPSKRWADYMKRKYKGVGEGVLISGTHIEYRRILF